MTEIEHSPLSVFLLARSLDVGGAQRQVVELAKEFHKRRHPVEVGLFYVGGALEAELRQRGIEIIDLGKRGRWDLIRFTGRLIRELRRRRPDVVYSFLGTANLLAACARPFVPIPRLIWSVLASNMDLSQYSWASRVSYAVESRLSYVPDLILSNSLAGAETAARDGFPREKIIVIPSGVDTDRFRPDAALRMVQRRSFGLSEDDVAIGVLARLDPMKGHSDLLEAAQLIVAKLQNVRFVFIGAGPNQERLEQSANDLGLAGKVLFTGEQEPVAALNALDILCSPSVWGEGLSNSVAEAMACGLRCVVTDVGDSAMLVSSEGTVVPPGAPALLADALLAEMASLNKLDPNGPRQRILAEFSASNMADRTLEAFRSISTRSG
jgi:glycosyltransferase involved in cell wall biosynthesis